ncbi:MAG: hypothetical protein JOZ81_34940 [Chloroflexi bacterium]|nr:hypothetical protein [Chloroflexota bacterium]
MNAMLVAIFAALGVGVLAPNLNGRLGKLAYVIAILLTLAYFVRPSYIT